MVRFNATILWHIDAVEWAPSTASLAAATRKFRAMSALPPIVLQNSLILFAGLGCEFDHPAFRRSRWGGRANAYQCLTQYLGWTSCCERRRGTAEELDQPPQVLRRRSEQHLIPGTTQASQSKPVEPEDALHVRKPHLDLLALPA